MNKIYNDVKRINQLDPVGPAERLCKLFEESGELAQAVNKTIGRKTTSESESKDNYKLVIDLITEEAADTIQCVFSLIDYYGITYEDLLSKLTEKNLKWENVIR